MIDNKNLEKEVNAILNKPLKELTEYLNNLPQDNSSYQYIFELTLDYLFTELSDFFIDLKSDYLPVISKRKTGFQEYELDFTVIGFKHCCSDPINIDTVNLHDLQYLTGIEFIEALQLRTEEQLISIRSVAEKLMCSVDLLYSLDKKNKEAIAMLNSLHNR